MSQHQNANSLPFIFLCRAEFTLLATHDMPKEAASAGVGSDMRSLDLPYQSSSGAQPHSQLGKPSEFISSTPSVISIALALGLLALYII